MYPPVRNAIVLMFDSMQYNYLGCNGNTWMKTPNFDRFARESFVFDNCYIEGLPTVPCRRAMHTGRYTLPVKGWSALDMDDTTIADLCWGSNIDTALIFDCPMYRLVKFGYTRGFDKVWFTHGHEADHFFYTRDELIHYAPEDFHEDHVLKAASDMGAGVAESLLHETGSYLKHRQYWKSDEDQNVAKVMKNAVKYLEGRDKNKPFFLWIDNFDPHEPWDSPSVYDPEMKCPYNANYTGKDQFLPLMGTVDGVYTEEELHHVRMLYAEKITMCDKWMGYFMDNAKRLGLEKDTMFMVVNDHGEPMGNGEHGHGIMRKCRPWPYEELAHGIMMIKAPGIKPGRTQAFAQSCDVAPTVCDWLGLGVRDFHQGVSLLPVCRRETEKVRDFAVAGYFKYSWSIITHDWSYIHWVKSDDDITEVLLDMYGRGMMEYAKDIGIKSINDLGFGSGTDAESLASSELKNAATLDGEDQWTCTPGSRADVPAEDELYDRRKDMAQLHNVMNKHPDVAQKLWDQLREFMGYLKTC